MSDKINSSIENLNYQIRISHEEVYSILKDQLKAIELAAEKVQKEALSIQIKMRSDSNKDLDYYTSMLEATTNNIANTAARINKLYESIVRQVKGNTHKELVPINDLF